MLLGPALAHGSVSAQESVAAGFVFPESVYFDPGTRSWFVSNFGPSPTPDAKDSDGFIARLDSSGAVLAERWVEGLGSPKGMRAHRGRLYVADVDTVVVIDIARARIVRRIVVPEAAVLNDLDLDRTGNVYVTDWVGGRIYRITPFGRVRILVAGPALESPNGILVEGRSLTVATWGTNMNTTTLTTEEPGRILRVDISRRTIEPLGSGERIGNLDGLERDGDSYLVTDWTGGRVVRVAMDGSSETVMQLSPSTADLGFDARTRTLGVPVFAASAAVFETVE